MSEDREQDVTDLAIANQTALAYRSSSLARRGLQSLNRQTILRQVIAILEDLRGTSRTLDDSVSSSIETMLGVLRALPRRPEEIDVALRFAHKGDEAAIDDGLRTVVNPESYLDIHERAPDRLVIEIDNCQLRLYDEFYIEFDYVRGILDKEEEEVFCLTWSKEDFVEIDSTDAVSVEKVLTWLASLRSANWIEAGLRPSWQLR